MLTLYTIAIPIGQNFANTSFSERHTKHDYPTIHKVIVGTQVNGCHHGPAPRYARTNIGPMRISFCTLELSSGENLRKNNNKVLYIELQYNGIIPSVLVVTTVI
jgi:hypothetical protein